ncbi:MAG: glycosyltransferase family 4 protein [Cytophagaceae bacterium]|nr:glycosyltransferase family 4 protein [Cytophagaceae bacterium]
MKILYLHQYFKTPADGGAIRSYYLAKGLVDRGYEVEMITSSNDKKDKTVTIEGITVHYLSVYYDNRLGFIGRSLSFLKFVKKAFKKAAAIKNVDLCYATSTPLTIGLIALKLKKQFNIPYYFEVRDLWPEAPIQMGAIKNRFIKNYLFGLERKIYENAQKVIALSPGIRDGIEKIIPNKPINILPNISDCAFFHPETKSDALEKKFNVKNKFVVSYFGAIGKVNHLEYFIDIIKKCQDQKLNRIHFLIAGKGSELSRIENLARSLKLNNVSFLGFLDKNGIKEILNVTDATYISFADKPILETNSPNKFFDGIAAGKLCIVNSKGWIMNMLEEKQCGFYADPYQPDDFIQKILPFTKDSSRLLLCQTNARKLAETYFSREVQVEKFARLFSNEEKLQPILPSVYTLTA